MRTPQAIELWPVDEVAAVLPEVAGRSAVLRLDGSLGHRPEGGADGGPWLEVEHVGLVHPRYLETPTWPQAAAPPELWLPGGWRFELGQGARAALSQAAAPPAVGTADEPTPAWLGKTGVPASEVFWLEERRGRGVWVTAHGDIDSGQRLDRASLWHSGLLRLGRIYLNPLRVRRIAASDEGFELEFELGASLRIVRAAEPLVARSLGLARLSELDPCSAVHAALYREGLRDFPADLARASAAHIKRWFAGEPRRLAANLLWQRVRWGRAGRAVSASTLGAWIGEVLRPLLAPVAPSAEPPPAWGGPELLALVRTLALDDGLFHPAELALGLEDDSAWNLKPP